MLALYGEYDWVMTENDHQIIVDIVDSNSPDTATLKILPKTGHLFSTFPSLKDSFDDEIGKINPEIYEVIWQWLEERIDKE